MKEHESQKAQSPTPQVGGNVSEQSWLEIVQKQVASLQYGVVQIVVHDGKVVQIERTEKLRLDGPRTGNPRGSQSASQ